MTRSAASAAVCSCQGCSALPPHMCRYEVVHSESAFAGYALSARLSSSVPWPVKLRLSPAVYVHERHPNPAVPDL